MCVPVYVTDYERQFVTSHPLGWIATMKQQQQQKKSVDSDTDTSKPLCIVGGNVK